MVRVFPAALAGGRWCSRKALANVFKAARDLASDNADSSMISDGGKAGRPNFSVTSIVPGGATRRENTEIASPAETASATAKAPQPRKVSVHGSAAASSARVAVLRMPQAGDYAANRNGSPAR